MITRMNSTGGFTDLESSLKLGLPEVEVRPHSRMRLPQ